MPRTELIQARTTPKEKRSYEHAAAMSDMTLTEWIRYALDENAARTLSMPIPSSND
jgi:uncharacterized protein (DUF1778 family)